MEVRTTEEWERAELIDGELFRMDAPTWTYQAILVKLILKIGIYLEQNKGKCKVMPAPFAVYIKKDNHNYVEPDITVICDEKKRSEIGCQGAPDWIVNAETETVTMYDFEHEMEAVRYSFSERIKAGIFEDLCLNLSEMDLG